MKTNLATLGGAVRIEIVRDGEIRTLGFLSAPRPGMLTFCESPCFVKAVRSLAPPYGVLTTPELAERFPDACAVGVSPAPRRAFFDLHNHLLRHTTFYGTSRPTTIDPAAAVHPSAVVAAENVSIGPGSIVGPHVTIQGRCMIGARVTVHAGVVLGADGFQHARFGDEIVELDHAGGLEIEDGVIVFANAVVARAVFHDRTIVGAGSRIGNLAFVSHNVRVGRRCRIGHGAVINGNVIIGDEVVIGPGCTVSNCLTIGDGAQVTLGSAVINDLHAGQRVTGNVAIDHRAYLRHIVGVAGRE